MKRTYLTFLCISLSLNTNAQTIFSGIDIYGTSQITVEQVLDLHESRLNQMASAWTSKDIQLYFQIREEVTDSIRALGDFAFLEISTIEYSRDDSPLFITIDVVDLNDKNKRLTLNPRPSDDINDPDSLLAEWERYEDLGKNLRKSGELEHDASCPAFHCTFGFGHNALTYFEREFNSKVPNNREILVQILRKDKDAKDRAFAAFLLAHIKNGRDLVRILVPSISDTSSFVRNNVLRVLADISQNHGEIEIPIEPILKALQYPNTTDRNKALAVLDGMAKNKEYRNTIIDKAGSTLIEILKLLQPNNHDWAYSILKELSGKDFGDRNVEAWTLWLNAQ